MFIGKGMWGIMINGCVGHSIEGGMLFSMGIRYNGKPWLNIYPLNIHW